MADISALKNRIRAAIKANDNQEITGPVLQQSLLDIVDELNNGTETEASTRSNADAALQQNITTEKNRAEEAESTLQQSITAEQTRAEGAESTLQQSITAEQTRAEGAESTLQQNITAEKNRAEEAEAILIQLVGAERTRAEGAEQDIQDRIDDLCASGFLYAGIATPSGTPNLPEDESVQVFYIAKIAGTYTNYGNLSIEHKGVYFILYDGTWSIQPIIDAVSGDGAFDISEYNKVGTTPAKYSSLSDALAALPAAYHRGGMSIKFIQLTPATYSVVKTEGVTEQPTGTEVQEALAVGTGSYTANQLSGITLPSAVGNSVMYYLAVTVDEVTTYTTWVITYASAESQEYVQYRLMSSAWSTAVSDWQGVDAEPAPGSRNFVESWGVYKATGNPSIDVINVGEGNVGYITNNGNVNKVNTLYRYSEPIFIERDCIVVATCKIGTSASAIAITDEQGTYYFPCIIGKDSTNVLTYSYSAKSGEYIAVSWNFNSGITLYSFTSIYSEYGNEIRKLNENLKALIPLKSSVISEDYTKGIWYGGQIGDEIVINYNSSYYCCIIQASKGDVFDITGSMPSYNATCLTVDVNNIILRHYNFADTGNKKSIIIEDDNTSFIIIQTDNLDYSGCVKHSNEIPQIKSTENDYDLAIRDYNGYILAMFNNGHIKTKNFDSSKSIGFASTVISRYSGKKMSLLGDSISTFGDPDSRNENGTYCYSYYPTETCRYSVEGTVDSYQSIKFDVENTYWMKLIRATGMVLGINESWRGSKVSGSVNSAFNNQTRIGHLGANGTPDVILVYGGTNDAGHSVSLGTFNTENPQNYTDEQIDALPVTTFADGYRTMLIRLMKTYPMAEIVVILPTFTTSYYTITNLDLYVEIIKEACDFFGIKYIDARCTGINVYNRASYMVDGIHPNVAGMQLLFEKIYRQLIFV